MNLPFGIGAIRVMTEKKLGFSNTLTVKISVYGRKWRNFRKNINKMKQNRKVVCNG